MIDPRPHLRALAEATAPGGNVTVPREWILAILDAPATTEEAGAPPAAFTVHELAERFRRSSSTIRLWLEQGRFEGAYKLRRRDWRVPPAAVAAFEATEQRGTPPKPRAKTVNLSDWRNVS